MHVERRGRMSTISSSTFLDAEILERPEQQKTGARSALDDALAEALADLLGGEVAGREELSP